MLGYKQFSEGIKWIGPTPYYRVHFAHRTSPSVGTPSPAWGAWANPQLLSLRSLSLTLQHAAELSSWPISGP